MVRLPQVVEASGLRRGGKAAMCRSDTLNNRGKSVIITDMSKVIEKKILPEYFDKIEAGEKTYELRLADWNCEQGDTLVLVEIDSATKEPTGRKLQRKVGFIGKTKDFDFWTKEEIDKYGYQIISLLDE